MYPILYEQITAGTVPAHNGLGVLSDCIECTVEQVKNGIYQLIMEYPFTGLHAEEIAERRVLKVKPNFTDNPQLFRINRVGKVMNGKFTVYANQISWDLSGYELTSGTASSAAAACILFQNAAAGYTFTTDKTVSATFKVIEPASIRSYMAGREGSFLDVFGKTEIKYDNFNVQFLQHAGTNRGVTIMYGKNLLELSQEIDGSNLYTHVIGYFKDNNNNVVRSDKKATGLTLDVPKTLIVDFSSEYSETPSVSTLNERTQKYINDNNLTTPKNNIKLNFAQSEELSNRVDLCDTVNVYYEALGITRANVQCIRVKWDCLREKYIETEFGDVKANATETIAISAKAIEEKPSSSAMNNAIAHATELITGNLGGYVVMHDSNGDGKPDEILIMDTEDIATATNVWRFNQNGLGHATSYAASNYALALTKDGQIVANRITSGTLNADVIKAGVLSDASGNSSINMTSGVASLKNLRAKLNFTLLGDNDVVKANLNHMGTDGSQFLLYDNNNHALVDLWAHNGDGSIQLNNSSGYQRVSLGGNLLRMQTASGKAHSELGLSANGGYLYLKDTNDNMRTDIHSNSKGGEVYFYNQSTLIAYLGAGSSSGDGVFFFKNSSGADKIYGQGQTGQLTCVSLVQTSSRKVKDNIKPITDEEARKILELQAVSFDYKNKDEGINKRGFIAEDVAEVLPNLVTPEQNERPATLDYIEMIPYLQAVIKDQAQQIEDQAQQIEAMNARIAALEKMVKSDKGE